MREAHLGGWEGVECDIRRATTKSTSCFSSLQFHENLLISKDICISIWFGKSFSLSWHRNLFLKYNSGMESNIGEDNWGQRCYLLFCVNTIHLEHGRIWMLMTCQSNNPYHIPHFPETDPWKKLINSFVISSFLFKRKTKHLKICIVCLK